MYILFCFSILFSGNQDLNCQVLVDNGQGSSLVLQLPCDTQTAVFITQLSKALYQLSKLVEWFGLP
jgi:hypothetical protein